MLLFCCRQGGALKIQAFLSCYSAMPGHSDNREYSAVKICVISLSIQFPSVS
ncbi:hypothetical protein EM595_p1030 (plasmid) [Duffyella gerundensis]|uniref:Uncharacterized protein n=1 Tax=Duffyella gerundensis TaxID=1619313 RepID=A0A0U5LAZ0_9GAMM|nr:hypothetical protein EM595_p1030 [Duffyella gerundensis]